MEKSIVKKNQYMEKGKAKENSQPPPSQEKHYHIKLLLMGGW
jgi:hypothetical protein